MTAVQSMTGFARTSGEHEGHAWTWELRSVNGRALDLRCRMPQGLDQLEPALRERLQARMSRGNVQAQLALRAPERGLALRLNRELLDRLIDLQQAYAGRVDPSPPRLEALLGVRGVVEAAEEEEEGEEALRAREAALLAGFERAAEALAAARREEGARLVVLLRERFDEMAALRREAGACASAQPEALRQRLKEKLRDLMEAEPSLPEERLAQEAALLATKADVREELDRIDAHLAAGRTLLAEGGAVGRRLDFLCQEFNREANTLCSKAGDVALTQVGLRLKAAVDQLREQVQNVE